VPLHCPLAWLGLAPIYCRIHTFRQLSDLHFIKKVVRKVIFVNNLLKPMPSFDGSDMRDISYVDGITVNQKEQSQVWGRAQE